MTTKAALKLIQSWRENNEGCTDDYRVTLLDLERIIEAMAGDTAGEPCLNEPESLARLEQ